ncbi:MAG TPA: type II secretion system protein GspK [Polyangiaceae bacterium LLY-WYZ-15_(1-7)]|nr:type II secretion system protein GspK [Polyangiaceae bacterium LLY-WYZ-15_(1-7)]HJL07008.1 type II secretion system protein GspK [Polyangiaceae bacterium LLY-WYZ-15_(1-7)]HJL30617.1 type II secretion system protein GspK [Polyangiaceae bacterium LLY-WYZ-15_(1-7)]
MRSRSPRRARGLFAASADSAGFRRATRRPRAAGAAPRTDLRGRAYTPERGRQRKGVALIIAITALAILSVVLADMHQSTSTAFAIAATQRDQLRAEYSAKSGLNLTRLLVAKEPDIRRVVAPYYQALIGRPPPMIPVWNIADKLLKPFCDYEQAVGLDTGFDFSSAQGLGDTGASCQIVSFAENSKINVNAPLNFSGDRARRSIAMQLFAMMGGYQVQSRYDPLFQQQDRDGQYTSRIDAVGAIIDWWDFDVDRTVFDPGRAEVSNSGSEDDIYRRLDDPYDAKNAPFDSLEELRLVRGMGDDFWSTFVEPRPDDPQARIVTIYGSGSVNPNEAPPEVLLARLCSYLEDQPLCADPTEGAKFVQLLSTARAMIPVPFFTRVHDFLHFVEGRGGPRDLYPMLQGFLGQESPLLFAPVTIPADRRTEIDNSFVTAARIITIDVTGRAGCRRPDGDGGCECDREDDSCWRGRVRLNTVVNFHERWTPPPPNAGSMPGLGIFHYYRVE